MIGYLIAAASVAAASAALHWHETTAPMRHLSRLARAADRAVEHGRERRQR